MAQMTHETATIVKRVFYSDLYDWNCEGFTEF